MLPYYILIFFPMLVTLIQSRRMIRIGGDTRADVPKGAVTAFFMIFMLMLMCRGVSCGSDMSNYENIFHKIGPRTWKNMMAYEDSIERGYLILNWLIYRFTDNFQVLVVAVAILSVWPLYRFYWRETEAPLLTMVLFLCICVFSMYFSGLRQIIAMGFAFPVWNCAKTKKPLRAIFLIALAMTFHKSALAMALIYPLYYIRITTKWLYFVVPAIAMVYFYRVPIFTVLVQLFWSESTGTMTDTGAVTMLLLLIILAVYSFVILDERKMDADMVGLRNILLLCVVIQCFAPIHQLAMRVNLYFLHFIPILIPKIAGRSKRKYYGIANLSVAVMVLFFAVYYIWSMEKGGDPLNIYPYVPFWREGIL